MRNHPTALLIHEEFWEQIENDESQLLKLPTQWLAESAGIPRRSGQKALGRIGQYLKY